MSEGLSDKWRREFDDRVLLPKPGSFVAKVLLMIIGVASGAVIIGTLMEGAGTWNEGSAIANAKATVTSMLNDPSSAQFQGVRAIKRDGDRILVCGQVNARNQFGGYVGFRDFAFDGHYAKLLTGDWSSRRSVWNAYKDQFSLCGVPEPEFRASDFRR